MYLNKLFDPKNMDNETKQLKQKIKSSLANYLGIGLEDIDDESTLTGDLHMSPTDLTDFMVELDKEGFEASDLDFTQIESFDDLVELLTSQI